MADHAENVYGHKFMHILQGMMDSPVVNKHAEVPYIILQYVHVLQSTKLHRPHKAKLYISQESSETEVNKQLPSNIPEKYIPLKYIVYS